MHRPSVRVIGADKGEQSAAVINERDLLGKLAAKTL
jgi:hypothetical protein